MELAIIVAGVASIVWALAWVAVRTEDPGKSRGRHEKRDGK